MKQIVEDLLSDYLNGLVADGFQDEWSFCALVFNQFLAESMDHDEGDLELIQAVVQEEVGDYLQARGLSLAFK